MPINYKNYPPNWLSELRPAVLLRADNKCESCRVNNYAVVRWDTDREAYAEYEYRERADTYKKARILWVELMSSDYRDDWLIIVLTIAHLDHNTENNELTNLKALCQRCHLNHDRHDNARRRKYGKNHEKAQFKLNLT